MHKQSSTNMHGQLQCRAAEDAQRKLTRQYNSDKHILKFFTAILDPDLICTDLGIKIAESFRSTQTTGAEHEHIQFQVRPTNFPNPNKAYAVAKWVRQVPRENEEHGDGTEFELIEREEPHVLLCFEAPKFTQEVIRDQFRSVLNTIETHCSGHRPHIVVLRLDQYLTKREREDFTAATAHPPGHPRRGVPPPTPRPAFDRRVVDDFITKLAIEHPRISFRDVSSLDEGANHVVCFTKAIAKSVVEKCDASKYLTGQAKSNKKSTNSNTAAVLAAHPVNTEQERLLLSVLCVLPSVGPQIAQAIAMKYHSLGGLMHFLSDSATSTAQKQAELENIPRASAARAAARGERAMRVGPKAARQVMDVLLGQNPDVKIKELG